MSFIGQTKEGVVYAPGYFLAHEECTRETREIPTTLGSGGVVKMGTIYPSNNSSAKGIVYEDVDVSTGNMPGSVVTKGTVIEGRLPVDLDSDAKTALEGLGFTFVTEGSVTRPY